MGCKAVVFGGWESWCGSISSWAAQPSFQGAELLLFLSLNDTSVPWPYMTCNTTCYKHILVSCLYALIHVIAIIISKRIGRHLCHIKHFSGHQESHLASTWTPALLTLIWLLLMSLLSQVLWVIVYNTRSPRLSLVWNLSGITTDLNKSGHCFLS